MKTILPLRLLIKPEQSDPQPLILYHGRNCPDGFSAALAAWLFYAGRAEFLGLDHGDIKSITDLPALDGRAVYILDFSFSPEITRQIEERAAKLVMLDHHKSAADKLTGFACRCGVVHFDMHKSGARLAWEFFHPEQTVPDLVRFVEDRDIWVWQYPESAGFLAALDMEPFEFERWRDIAAFDAAQLASYVERGRAMDEKFSKLAFDIAEGALPISFNGQRGLMVNASGVFHSLVGEILSRKSGTFALMWSVDK
ncbi:MAG TPA: phosphoesterase, partial [Rhodoferax sp.]